jgi:preprotein translocase subunit SecG
MLSIVVNIFYVLIAVGMVVLILLQRGAGAAAGSGFGAGASATVFGARGSANFLSRSTAVLAGLFFLLSLGMGIYLGHLGGGGTSQSSDDLGVMAGVATPEEKPATETAPVSKAVVVQPAASGDKPAPTPVAADPEKPAASAGKPAAAPAAAASDKPAASADKPAAAPAAAASDKPAASADKPAAAPATAASDKPAAAPAAAASEKPAAPASKPKSKPKPKKDGGKGGQ